MTIYVLKRSQNSEKKWSLSDGQHTVDFGQKGYEDYTMHKDPVRKQRYIGRHVKKEHGLWQHTKQNLMTPSYLSRYILWHKPDLQQAITYVENRQGIKINR